MENAGDLGREGDSKEVAEDCEGEVGKEGITCGEVDW